MQEALRELVIDLSKRTTSTIILGSSSVAIWYITMYFNHCLEITDYLHRSLQFHCITSISDCYLLYKPCGVHVFKIVHLVQGKTAVLRLLSSNTRKNRWPNSCFQNSTITSQNCAKRVLRLQFFHIPCTWTANLGILAKTVPTVLTALLTSSGYVVRINNWIQIGKIF